MRGPSGPALGSWRPRLRAASLAGAARAGQAGRPPPGARECAVPVSEERAARRGVTAAASRPPRGSRCPRRTRPRTGPHTPHRRLLRAERSRGRADAWTLGAGREAEVDSLRSLPAPDRERGVLPDESVQRHRDEDLRPGPQATLKGPQVKQLPLRAQNLLANRAVPPLADGRYRRPLRRTHGQRADEGAVLRRAARDAC